MAASGKRNPPSAAGSGRFYRPSFDVKNQSPVQPKPVAPSTHQAAAVLLQPAQQSLTYKQTTIENLVHVPAEQILFLSREAASEGVLGEDFVYILCTVDFRILTCRYTKATQKHGCMIGKEYYAHKPEDLERFRRERQEYEEADAKYRSMRNRLTEARGFYRADDCHENTINHMAVRFYQEAHPRGGIVMHTERNFIVLGARELTEMGKIYPYGVGSFPPGNAVNFYAYIEKLIHSDLKPQICPINLADQNWATDILMNVRATGDVSFGLSRNYARAEWLLENCGVRTAEIIDPAQRKMAWSRLLVRVADLGKTAGTGPDVS
jgi:hypothetical protein